MARKDLEPGDTARLLGVAIGTLANWRTQGIGPDFRKRRPHRNAAVLYDRREVIRWGKRNGYIEQEREAA